MLEFIPSASLSIWYLFNLMKPTRESAPWFAMACVGVVALGILIVAAQREFTHAIFDIADCALKNGNKSGSGEGDNPFVK